MFLTKRKFNNRYYKDSSNIDDIDKIFYLTRYLNNCLYVHADNRLGIDCMLAYNNPNVTIEIPCSDITMLYTGNNFIVNVGDIIYKVYYANRDLFYLVIQ